MEPAEELTRRPIQGISSAEAAGILGIDRSSVDRLVMRGVLHGRPGSRATLWTATKSSR